MISVWHFFNLHNALIITTVSDQLINSETFTILKIKQISSARKYHNKRWQTLKFNHNTMFLSVYSTQTTSFAEPGLWRVGGGTFWFLHIRSSLHCSRKIWSQNSLIPGRFGKIDQLLKCIEFILNYTQNTHSYISQSNSNKKTFHVHVKPMKIASVAYMVTLKHSRSCIIREKENNQDWSHCIRRILSCA